MEELNKDTKLSPFDIIKSINEKTYIVFDSVTEKQYNPFIINRGLSQFLDCVPYTYKMNILCGLPKKMQYDYLYYSIRKGKRFASWAKQQKYNYLDDIIDCYNVNKRVAIDILDRLTDEQVISIVNQQQNTGGLSGKIKKINKK